MPDISSPVSTGDERLDELLKNGAILPSQCHGDGENLCLDGFAAAVYVGCCTATIYRAGLQGEIRPVPQKSKKATSPLDYIRAYPLPQLRLMRERWQQHNDGTYTTKEGKRVRLRNVAERTGLNYRSLLKELREPHRLSIFADLHITPVEMRSPRHGQPELTILEAEAVSIGWAIDRALKKGKSKGYSQVSEIADQLGLTGTAQRRQLAECLKLWVENGQLKSESFLVLMPGKVTTRTDKRAIEVNKLYLRTAYESKMAIQLWKALDTKAAAEKLRSLLKSGPRRATEIHTEMHAAGFPDHLIYQAARKLKAVRRIESFRGPHVYELRTTPRKDARKVVKGILKDGPMLVSEVKKLLHEAGWSFHSPAVKKAVADLQIKALCGPALKKWWCKPGQKPPQAPRPALQRIIAFVQSHLADGKPHPFQEIVSEASNHGITKYRLVEAVPFLSGLERDRKRDAKGKLGSSTWRLAQANATANGASSQSANVATHAADPAPKRRGRPKGRDPEVVQREKEMLAAWDRGEFLTKAEAGRAFGFHRQDATNLINAHERRKCKK